MKEDPLKRGGQHLEWVQAEINVLGEYVIRNYTDVSGKLKFYEKPISFKTVGEYITFRLKERIKGI